MPAAQQQLPSGTAMTPEQQQQARSTRQRMQWRSMTWTLRALQHPCWSREKQVGRQGFFSADQQPVN